MIESPWTGRTLIDGAMLLKMFLAAIIAQPFGFLFAYYTLWKDARQRRKELEGEYVQ